MAQDVLDPTEPVLGPQKYTLTEKARDGALAQSTKRAQAAQPAPVHPAVPACNQNYLSHSGTLHYTHIIARFNRYRSTNTNRKQ